MAASKQEDALNLAQLNVNGNRILDRAWLASRTIFGIMDATDHAAEWRRLKETYQQMSEEELANIADEAYQLTDLAKDALQTEVSSRKLDLTLRMEPPEEDGVPEPAESREVSSTRFWSDELEDGEDGEEISEEFDPETLDLTIIARLWDTDEANRIKNALDGAGIPSYIGDQNAETVDEYTGKFDGGVDLKVRAVDQQWALHTLANAPRPPAPEEQDIEQEADDEAEYAVRCPKCRSAEVVFEGRNGVMEGNEAFHAKFEWHCDSCGHDWEDDGVEQPV